MKKYVVVERYRKRDGFDVINEDTTSLTDIWHSCVPNNIRKSEVSKLRPMVFETRGDAVRYKDAQQSLANHDWRENDYIYRRYGDQKPRWKVEEFTGDLFK